MNNLIRSVDRPFGMRLFGDVDNIVNGFFRAPMTPSLDTSVRLPAIDISETDSAYLIKTDLPGMRKQDLDITIDDGVLTINAEHAEETDEKKPKEAKEQSPITLNLVKHNQQRTQGEFFTFLPFS